MGFCMAYLKKSRVVFGDKTKSASVVSFFVLKNNQVPSQDQARFDQIGGGPASSGNQSSTLYYLLSSLSLSDSAEEVNSAPIGESFFFLLHCTHVRVGKSVY